MKKTHRNVRKGFTLVELIVVIAIVAILGAVSVVGYFAFIDKANRSADEQLITQINTVLQASETLDGKNETMHDAMNDLHESGIKDEELVESNLKNTDYVWDQTSDRFALVDNKKQEVIFSEKETKIDFGNPAALWKVYDDLNTEKESTILKDANYSIYLADTTKEIPTAFETTNGFDVGSLNEETMITYDGDKAGTNFYLNDNVELTVANPNADVNVYGNGNILNIEAASNNSVHVYGTFTDVLLTNGHLDIKSGANVTNIKVQALNPDDIQITSEVDKTYNVELLKEDVAMKNAINATLGSDKTGFSTKDFIGKLGEKGDPHDGRRFAFDVNTGTPYVYTPDKYDPFTYKMKIETGSLTADVDYGHPEPVATYSYDPNNWKTYMNFDSEEHLFDVKTTNNESFVFHSIDYADTQGPIFNGTKKVNICVKSNDTENSVTSTTVDYFGNNFGYLTFKFNPLEFHFEPHDYGRPAAILNVYLGSELVKENLRLTALLG